MAQQDTAISNELLEDFYSECEEHLGKIRECVALLEKGVAQQNGDSVSQRLFRSFHTLKGNSGIIGLREAEQLAHAIEDFLRKAAGPEAITAPRVLNLIAQGAAQFEQVIAAFRSKKPLPDIQPFILELTKADEGESVQPPAQTAQEETGKPLWQFVFKPSPELDKRGVNVTSVRARLSEAGSIINAAPVIHPTGGISFNFLVAVNSDRSDWSEWESDNITAEKFQKPATAEQTATDEGGKEPTAHNPFLAPSHLVRVDLPRLDELMRIAGEMVVQRARLDDQISRIENKHPAVDVAGLREVNHNLERHLRDMRDSIMRVRLVRMAEVFDRMPFVVRDIARETGKQVRVTHSGAQTEIDKYVVEKLKDPFLHLVRNAVSHGIETSEQRTAIGKPAEATIHLAARTVGDVVVIEISDDGAGVDKEQVIERARKMGLVVPATIDDAAVLELISTPGFSTRDEADLAAGRGVGMAVVVHVLHEIGGTLHMESSTGQGTKFTLRLPLTLAIADAFVVTAGGQNFAVPQSSIFEIVEMDPSTTQKVDAAELLLHRGGSLPLFSIAKKFGLPTTQKKSQPVVVIETERGKVGLVVDRVVCQREIVVRPLRDPLLKVAGVSGATELGDGKPVLILDPPVLARSN